MEVVCSKWVNCDRDSTHHKPDIMAFLSTLIWYSVAKAQKELQRTKPYGGLACDGMP